MERYSLSNKKDSGVGGRILRDKDKATDSWDCNRHSFGGDYPGGYSWPPRSYRCSFCKREFRSAQALGGHMNVHRRDRARLRQSPPWDGQCLNLNLDPNPNPNLNVSSPSSSSLSAMIPPFTYSFPSLLSNSHTCLSLPSSASTDEAKMSKMPGTWHDPLSLKGADLTRMKSMKDLFVVGELKGSTQEDEGDQVLKKGEIVRLGLDIGLLRESKEDLDLELRLGYS
ncbi:hypothetical protein HHK36_020515 [Tetracentron sinense]|uniref:C2H2-type domain-containing protein n=1 Tax=Tetracentron sinense TaxID=13715 RepID=A0A835D832_TETSI|nr:hypothetical protein HHK36_020515 [Tetracentron sinense]